MSGSTQPGACVRRILDEAELILRGNHDHALATGAAPGCPPSFQWLAEARAQLGVAQLSTTERVTLAELPLRASQFIDGIPYHLVHATPTDPMYRHLEPTSDGWAREVREIGPEVLHFRDRSLRSRGHPHRHRLAPARSREIRRRPRLRRQGQPPVPK